ncbi:hypothetical protein D3C71_1576260 [compost metagenome]
MVLALCTTGAKGLTGTVSAAAAAAVQAMANAVMLKILERVFIAFLGRLCQIDRKNFISAIATISDKKY